MLITILTPTYNRANRLENLFNSLFKQTCLSFEWLIVDDGSTDDTNRVCKSFTNDLFKVTYLYKDNGGKHTAINLGIKNVNSKLVFIVDSDDILEFNAIERIKFYYNKYKFNKSICGFSFLRKLSNGQINGKLFRKNELVCSYIESRINSDDTMSDKAEVFYTDVLKNFPFPEFKNEKFLGEDIVWIKIARKYDMVHINEAIYVGDYLLDGLTKNRKQNNINSCHGSRERALQFMSKDIKLKYRIKGTLQFIIYSKFCQMKFKYIIKNVKNKILVLIFYLPGLIIYKKWEKKYGESK